MMQEKDIYLDTASGWCASYSGRHSPIQLLKVSPHSRVMHGIHGDDVACFPFLLAFGVRRTVKDGQRGKISRKSRWNGNCLGVKACWDHVAKQNN